MFAHLFFDFFRLFANLGNVKLQPEQLALQHFGDFAWLAFQCICNVALDWVLYRRVVGIYRLVLRLLNCGNYIPIVFR